MIKLNREQLLTTLEQLRPGVSARPDTPQSQCIAFVDGNAVTFRQNVNCVIASPFREEVQGAVPAAKFYETLATYGCEEVKVSQKDNQLLIQPGERKKGEREVARIDMVKEITMPIDLVPLPSRFGNLDPAFCDALKFVSSCGKGRKGDPRAFVHYVHFHPDFVEAIDGKQACRWPMATGCSSFVSPTEDVRSVAWLGVNEIGEVDEWACFRSPTGLVYSCRRTDAESAGYPSLDELFSLDGAPVKLPKGMARSAAMGEVFSKADEDHNDLIVSFAPGFCTVTGIGPLGEYSCEREVEYDGPEMEFYMQPDRLKELVEKHSECVLLPGKLKVATPDYSYVTVLVAREDVEGGTEED